MNDELDFKVSIKLKTNDIFDVESRTAEVREIHEWIEQLVRWDSTQYRLRYKTLGYINVWFKQEKHAIFCSLRWS